MKRRAMVPTSIPPAQPTPNEILPLAPTPCAKTRGNMPNIMVSEVIRMGRRRTLAAVIAAIVMLMPWRCRSVAYSVNRMAVFAKSPMSIMRPVCM